MKFNKLMVACIFLLAILTFGAASAADENVTDTTGDVLAVESVDEDVIAGATGTFSDLKTLVDNTATGKTLKLDKDYVINDNSKITISKTITIDGQGHTIDANNRPSSPFIIYEKAIFKNITFINGASTYLDSEDKISVYDCSFKNYSGERAAMTMGDAYRCTFINCYSTGNNEAGAISYVNAYNCYFENCSGKWGSAIYGGTASNCTFVNCKGFVAIGSVSAKDITYGSPAQIFVYGDWSAGEVNVTVNGETKKVRPGSSVSFYDLIAGTYRVKVVYPGNTNFEAQSLTTSFKVKKANTFDHIGVSPANPSNNGQIPYDGKNATLYINKRYYSYIPGYFNVIINGISQKVDPSARDPNAVSSMVPVYLGILNVGSYDITVSYDGTESLNAQTKTLSFEVIQVDPIISVSAADVGYGQDAVIKVKLNKNLQGNLDVVLNGITKNVKITGETENVRFSGLAMGNYNVTVSYPGSDKFPAQNMTSSFNVVKGTPIASGAVNPNPVGFGDDAIIKVNMLNSNINGNIWFTISDENKTKILTDKIHIEYGIATKAIPGLGLGKYYLHLYYAGNTHFKAQTIKGNFEVAKKTPIASVNISNWVPGENVKIKVRVNGVNGNVWFTVSYANKTKILTDKIHIEDGWAIASIPGLTVGKYYLHIYYAGNVHYNAQTIKSNFEVTKISPELFVAKTTVDGKTVLTASVAEDARGNVKFEVNGTVYKAPIVNGVANLTLPDMASGTYRLTSSYAGNYKYLPETKIRSITIK